MEVILPIHSFIYLVSGIGFSNSKPSKLIAKSTCATSDSNNRSTYCELAAASGGDIIHGVYMKYLVFNACW